MPGNDTYTKLLLHMFGSNGSQVFVDDSVGNTAADFLLPLDKNQTLSINPVNVASCWMDSTRVITIGVNSSYCVATCTDLTNYTPIVGSEVTVNASATSYISITRMDSTHAIATFCDGGNSYYGTAVCLTLSGTTITVGTPVVFNSNHSYYLNSCSMDSSHAIVVYNDAGNSDYCTAVCLTLSGTTITVGTPVVVDTVPTTFYNSICSMDSTHAIVAYKGKVKCITLSGTTITAYTSASLSSNAFYYTITCMDSSHAIVCYRDFSSSYGIAVCISLSGTTVSVGSTTTFNSGLTAFLCVESINSSNAIVSYADSSNSNYCTICYLTLSGTTVSYDTPIVLDDTSSTVCTSISIIGYDKALILYQLGSYAYSKGLLLSSGHHVIPYGNAQIDTSTYEFPPSSGLFTTSSDYLTIADSNDWYFNTDFSIDFRDRFLTTQNRSFYFHGADSNTYLHLYWETSNKLYFFVASGGTTLLHFYCDWTPSLSTWYHVALVRFGNTWYLFINGISQTLNLLNGSYSATLPNAGGNVVLARSANDSSYYLGGNFNEYRISNGIARWTSNFTPSPEPYSDYSSSSSSSSKSSSSSSFSSSSSSFSSSSSSFSSSSSSSKSSSSSSFSSSSSSFSSSSSSSFSSSSSSSSSFSSSSSSSFSSSSSSSTAWQYSYLLF